MTEAGGSPRLEQPGRERAGALCPTPQLKTPRAAAKTRRAVGLGAQLEQVGGWLSAAGHRAERGTDAAGRSSLIFEMDRRRTILTLEPLSGWCTVRLLGLERELHTSAERQRAALAIARANHTLRFAVIGRSHHEAGRVEAVVRAPAIEHLFTRVDLEAVLAELSRAVRAYNAVKRTPSEPLAPIGRPRGERAEAAASAVAHDRLETIARWIRQDCELSVWAAAATNGRPGLEIDLSAGAVATLCLDERGLSIAAAIAVIPTADILLARLENLIELADPASLSALCLDIGTNTLIVRAGLPLFGAMPDADLVVRSLGDLDRTLTTFGRRLGEPGRGLAEMLVA